MLTIQEDVWKRTDKVVRQMLRIIFRVDLLERRAFHLDVRSSCCSAGQGTCIPSTLNLTVQDYEDYAEVNKQLEKM